jgi:transcriptional regulator with XRE-family HTH domain
MKGESTVFRFNMAEVRKAKGITQVQLAAQLNVKQPRISQWESGLHFPTLPQLVAIADALDCTLDELAGRNTTTNRTT